MHIIIRETSRVLVLPKNVRNANSTDFYAIVNIYAAQDSARENAVERPKEINVVRRRRSKENKGTRVTCVRQEDGTDEEERRKKET